MSITVADCSGLRERDFPDIIKTSLNTTVHETVKSSESVSVQQFFSRTLKISVYLSLLLFVSPKKLYQEKITAWSFFSPDSEALKVRVSKVGLERTSIRDLARPPRLVNDTAKAIA